MCSLAVTKNCLLSIKQGIQTFSQKDDLSVLTPQEKLWLDKKMMGNWRALLD